MQNICNTVFANHVCTSVNFSYPENVCYAYKITVDALSFFPFATDFSPTEKQFPCVLHMCISNILFTIIFLAQIASAFRLQTLHQATLYELSLLLVDFLPVLHRTRS